MRFPDREFLSKPGQHVANLILIDGPPGSGKSTLAGELGALLPEYRVLGEMDEGHPLHPVPVGTLGADFAELRDMDVAELGELLLAKWMVFVASIEISKQAFTIESYPYQSHARVLWQMNAADTYLHEWLARLHKVLAPLNPILVMLRFGGGEDRVKLICERRGQEWTDFAIDFTTTTAYGQSLGLKGFEGALAFFNAYNSELEAWSNHWPFQLQTYEAWAATPDQQARQVVDKLGSV